jgi:TATA-box binding protein (TBP) (component of TFIID and TFIIIB)
LPPGLIMNLMDPKKSAANIFVCNKHFVVGCQMS